MTTHRVPATLAALALLGALPPASAGPDAILQSIEREARAADPAFAGFDARRGAAFFTATHGQDWSCASCHTQDPTAAGRHASTGKTIAPLAPAANPDRFTDPAKVAKWFRRNCNDVVDRACTPREQGDVLAWLMSRGR